MRKIVNGIQIVAIFAVMSSLAAAAERYQVVRLGSLGGTASGANSVNNRGWVTGFSNLPGDTIAHATLWTGGSLFDLGTLGGPNSSVAWPVKNTRGLIVGIAETPDIDPYDEEWSCAAFFPSETPHICLGFVWEQGVMTALPTLGGNNGYAAAANNQRQVVGWAENTVADPTCEPPQVLQFRAVTWHLEQGDIQELPPLAGDTSSAATAINDRGQVVGISGICDQAVGRFSAAHAVLWEGGVPTDIGNLGGLAWNTPAAINDRGEIAGFSDLPGDEDGGLNAHAFLWTSSGGIQDLGTLPGDTLSLAFGINNKRQVVGLSIGPGGARAFLWENGVMTDLNTLVPPGSLHLDYANDINDRQEIVGGASDSNTGETLAYQARPSHGAEENGAVSREARSAGASTSQRSVPEHVRRMLRQRWGIDLESGR